MLEDFGRLTKRKIKVQVKDKIVTYKPAKHIILSAIFFKRGLCIACGNCCKKIDTNLFVTEPIHEDLKKEFNVKIPVIVKNGLLNKKKTNVFVYSKSKNCGFLDEDNKCKIHKNKPLQCRIHPIHIDTLRDSIYIKKRQYKRNFAFGCQMEFKKFGYKRLVNYDIPFLKDMDKMAKQLGFDTYLPEVINYLEARLEDYKNGKLPIENIQII